VFGKLERLIQEYCINRDHYVEEDKDDTDNINSCMALLTSYTRLTIARGNEI